MIKKQACLARTCFTFFLVAIFAFVSYGQDAPKTFNNPIIPGFYPDPSVCRVGDDYYLATSSFEWFPGIPLFHSKDLVNWRQIGHALTRPSQLNMVNNKNSSGVWAPTIRFHDGKFYVIVTCKQCGNNMYVTADSPEGPYSDPVYLKTPPGIDPSLFWDDDGRCWFTANRFPKEMQWPAQHIVYIQELDLNKGELIGEPIDLTYGMAEGVQATEAPHIYKINGLYYLITAEGMTWTNHMVCMYYSDKVTGPYKQVPENPVLSHKNLPKSPIQHTGHADLIQTPAGDWWSVMLGVRKMDDNYYLGRETFLTPVAFDGIQPKFNPGKMEILMEDVRPDLPWTPVELEYSDDFSGNELEYMWNFLRTPQSKWFSLDERKGWLTLYLQPETVKEACSPAFIARRFQHHQFKVFTKMNFKTDKENEVAGLVALQNDRFHYRLEKGLKKGEEVISLMKVFSQNRKEFKETLVAQVPYKLDHVVLTMQVNNMTVKFGFGPDEENITYVGGQQSCDAFTSNRAGGFIGAYVGMYASSEGQESSNKATFDWFTYEPKLND